MHAHSTRYDILWCPCSLYSSQRYAAHAVTASLQFLTLLSVLFFSAGTSNLDIVWYCQEQFCFELPSVILARRTTKFKVKFGNFLSNTYN